jgi:anti-anti-sigma factor
MMEVKVSPVGRGLRGSDGAWTVSAPQLNTVLERELKNDRSRIILDLAGVNYMSAAGLRVIRALHDQSGSVHIARPSVRVREIMQMTGLDTVYRMYETRVNAIHALTPVTNAHTHLTELAGELLPGRDRRAFCALDTGSGRAPPVAGR